MARDTLLIDGTDISTTARILAGDSDWLASPDLKGSLALFPAADGEVNSDQPFAPFSFPVRLQIIAATPTALNDEYRTLKRLCKVGQTITLTKRVQFGTGQEDYTATAKLIQITPSPETGRSMRVALQFSILDGLWYGPIPAAIGTGVVAVDGDVRTQRLSIALSGGTNPTLTNSTNGWSMTYTGSTATTVTVSVLAMTASQAGVDVSHNLSWNKTYPFRLNAGANTLAISSGSAAITYRPAFL
jgi:phage-related protein